MASGRPWRSNEYGVTVIYPRADETADEHLVGYHCERSSKSGAENGNKISFAS